MKNPIFWVLLLLWAFELSFQPSLIHLDNYWKPVAWLGGNVLFCLLALLILKKKESRSAYDIALFPAPGFWRWALPGGVFVAGLLLVGMQLQRIFQEIPIDPNWSDIVPSLELYVERFLAGEKVYRPMYFPRWTVLPTYLPVMWLPYVPAELLNFDYRWTAYGLFSVAIAAWLWRMYRFGLGSGPLIVAAALPYLALFWMTNATRSEIFGMAVELMPVGLYLFLALALMTHSSWKWALAILLCLLSRYAFSFWLPLFFLILWWEESFRKSFRTGLLVLLGVGLLYVLPFLSRDWSILQDGLAYYKTTAEGQWRPQTFQDPSHKPHHLDQGFSFAIYFYDFVEGPVEERLAANRKAHLLASLVAAGLLLLGYFLLRRHLDWRLYLLVGLKLYLSIFYGFFYVPFSYLYWLPLFLGLPIIYNILAPYTLLSQSKSS